MSDGGISSGDARRYTPAFQRNRDVIKDVLARHLTDSGTILEIASGSGEHAAYTAPHFPDYIWQPSDIDDANLASIEAWREAHGCANVMAPVMLDALQPRWSVEMVIPNKEIRAIVAINLIHISPWQVTEAVINGADRLLSAGDTLYFYGPYTVDGEHTAQSNAQFDDWLKEQNTLWGVRDMGDVTDIAQSYGFSEPEITPMPANNFSLVFKKL